MWLPKHRGTLGALLDITLIGAHWLILLENRQMVLFIFHFSRPQSCVYGTDRLVLGTTQNSAVWVNLWLYDTRKQNVMCHDWPLVEWVVSKRTRVCENIQMVSAVCAFPFSSCVFIACGDTGFHPEGRIQPRDNPMKFQHLFSEHDDTINCAVRSVRLISK